MTVPGFDPRNPQDPEGPFETAPADGDILDFDSIIEFNRNPRDILLDKLRGTQVNALEKDEAGHDNFYGNSGRLALQGNLARFTWPDTDPRVMHSNFYVMDWIPKEGTTTVETVDRIVVRIPVLQGIEFGVFGEAPMIPQDVFVEIQYKDGKSYKYFFNSNTPEDELLGYEDAQHDLDHTDAEIQNLPQGHRYPSVYRLKDPVMEVPEKHVSDLKRMIDDSDYYQIPKPQTA